MELKLSVLNPAAVCQLTPAVVRLNPPERMIVPRWRNRSGGATGSPSPAPSPHEPPVRTAGAPIRHAVSGAFPISRSSV